MEIVLPIDLESVALAVLMAGGLMLAFWASLYIVFRVVRKLIDRSVIATGGGESSIDRAKETIMYSTNERLIRKAWKQLQRKGINPEDYTQDD